MPFRLANVAGRSALVDQHGNWFDAAALTNGAINSNPMIAITDPAALSDASAGLDAATPSGTLAKADVRAPIPEPRNVFAIGLNYRDHAAESAMELPANPLVFTKFPSCIVAPDADVELRSTTADWEAELVVVIGQPGRDIAAEDAWNHVAGLTVGQDVSDRALQFAAKPPHFDLGKSRDTYGPIGPVMVSTDAFDDPADLAITCDVNGDTKQSDRTSNLIFSIPEVITYLSAVLTLRTGDLIFTGTPSGVGAATQTFLQPGDIITTTIEGIGTMTNHCVA